MDNSKQLKLGALLSYGQMALSILIGIIYTPVMLRLLGQNEYGLYNTVSSTISMLSILNLGFNAGYIRYYARYKKEGKTEDIYKLNGLFLIIFAIIGAIALACGLFLTTHTELVFDEGLTASEYSTARVLMFLLTINLACSFPASVFVNIISANEKFVILKLLSMLTTVLSPLVTLPLLLMGYKSIALVSVTVALSFFRDFIYIGYVFKKLHNKFIFHGFEKNLFKSLFIYTGFIAINLIVDQINWNIDKLLLARFKGTAMVAVYSVGYALYGYYQSFSTAISGVFTPKIHRIHVESGENYTEKKKRLTVLFTRVGRIQFLILALIASGVVIFGKYFILEIWAGKGYEDSYWVAVLLMLSSSIALIQNLGIEIQRAQNKHHFRSIAYAAMSVINLILSIYLCQRYGAIGSAIGTALALVVANGLIMNIYYHKKCNIDILYFWKNILRMFLGLAVPVALGIVIILFVRINSVWMFLGLVLLYAIVYCISMWFLAMNQSERDLIIRPFMVLTRKFKKAK